MALVMAPPANAQQQHAGVVGAATALAALADATPGGSAPQLPPLPAPPSLQRPSVKISDDLLQSLAVGKVFRDHKGTVNGLDFTYDGSHVVTSGDDSNVYVYNTEKAQRRKHLRCEKYGVSHIKFLHNDKDACVAASRNDAGHALKYWDIHENKYLRLFRSHTAKTISISPHPYEDLFLSGSDDKTVLLWDLRQDRPTAKIAGHGPTQASFDLHGLVFAACVGQPKIHLFDTRAYQKGEFTAFDLSTVLKADPHVHHVQFSPCGKYVLVRTASKLMLVDAFDGEQICEYPVTASPAGMVPPVPNFSPDSQYVISGTAEGDVCIWAATNARLVHRLEGHTSAPGHAAFSPAHALVVTAAETLAWWIPDTSSTRDSGSLPPPMAAPV